MAAEWFYRSGNSEHGPVEPVQLAVLAASGELKPGDQVRKGHAGQWVTAEMVRGLTFPEQGSLGAGRSGNVQVEAKVNDVGQPATSDGSTLNQYLPFHHINLHEKDHIAKLTKAQHAMIILIVLLLRASVVCMALAVNSRLTFDYTNGEVYSSWASWFFSCFMGWAALGAVFNGLRACVILLTDIRDNVGR